MYKTMVLEPLKRDPVLHQQLKRDRIMLPSLDRYAQELKASHEAWKERLSQQRPESSESQVASEALELALKSLENHLSAVSPPDMDETLSLDQAIAFIRKPTPAE
jgi:hypothetical protein